MNILTYGTFDLFHFGHLRLLKRAKAMGTTLYVGVSSDGFNMIKGKRSYFDQDKRMEILQSCIYVDHVFLENSWEQKQSDILKFKISKFVIGDDWKGKFDYLSDFCDVIYIDRTVGISTTKIKHEIFSGDRGMHKNHSGQRILA